ncbi:hypothetical protein [Mesorhizobium sp. M7A.F.Ca.MR.362.00.0.0]|uniref:hypothetical protein n=1 Tax=Mesorhizobium sp. M7A.F.Ca.MR.362.00.0.0 TaxID=2496779 RepID=UPI000FD5FB89|nr:hypothetical protein [Mesorhizobium sp. M7A.F.Ca.MR.362.00.0.0]RUU78237.1 hypothetical protein EOC06_20695 [Mesorhizobium sp. M7A.F.Ca.MR.362.00.0.0]RWN95427.1 MAG: hypothetical protein EOS05_11580 [Mesorhizobium sp.]
MRILPDLSQPKMQRVFAKATVVEREDGFSQSHSMAEVEHRVWNKMSKERVKTSTPLPEPRAQISRQHQAPIPRNARRLYSPQDQRGVETRFVIMDRQEGQVLARVKGSALHCEKEAEKLARSQGCELADLKVIFEGELS